MIDETVRIMGKIDIMVCNAGIGGTTTYAVNVTEENWDNITNTDAKAVFFTGQAAAKQMIKQGHGGRIINISSAAAMGGSNGMMPYCAAKAAVINITKAEALEWARYGITVNVVCPGYVPTSINEGSLDNPKVKKGIEDFTLLKRVGRIDEISGAVLYLASDASSYMTGTHLLIDGGAMAQ